MKLMLTLLLAAFGLHGWAEVKDSSKPRRTYPTKRVENFGTKGIDILTSFAGENEPALEHPELGWGAQLEGCRMALEMLKTEYAEGEEIIVGVLLRNETDHYASFALYYGKKYDYETPVCKYELEDVRSKEVLKGEIPQPPMHTGIGGHVIEAYEQSRFWTSLKYNYQHIPPGEYRIRAFRRPEKPNGREEVGLSSNWVAFKVIAKEKHP